MTSSRRWRRPTVVYVPTCVTLSRAISVCRRVDKERLAFIRIDSYVYGLLLHKQVGNVRTLVLVFKLELHVDECMMCDVRVQAICVLNVVVCRWRCGGEAPA